MNHVDDLLARQLVGALNAAEWSELTSHLAACERCRRLAREEAALWERLAADGVITPVDDVDLRPALRARLAAAQSAPVAPWRWRLATAALVILGAWLGGRLSGPPAVGGDGVQALAGTLLWEETAATLDGLFLVAAAPGDAAVAGDAEVAP